MNKSENSCSDFDYVTSTALEKWNKQLFAYAVVFAVIKQDLAMSNSSKKTYVLRYKSLSVLKHFSKIWNEKNL